MPGVVKEPGRNPFVGFCWEVCIEECARIFVLRILICSERGDCPALEFCKGTILEKNMPLDCHRVYDEVPLCEAAGVDYGVFHY